MVQPAVPCPPGCPQGWPIRLEANSGIQIVYGAPHSRQPPGVRKFRGIGIKMRQIPNWADPNLPDHESSWAGLYDQRLFDLYYPFEILSNQKLQREQMVLNLPMMGMPPREPTEALMQQVRTGQKLGEWFTYAYVLKATDFPQNAVRMSETRGPYDNEGDDVLITLPRWPNAPKAPDTSLYGETENNYGFEFRTALPDNDSGHDPRNIHFDNLYFIQLLPNELPSYHFWNAPTDNLRRPNQKGVRLQADAKGSAHFDAAEASRLQSIRSQPSPKVGSKRAFASDVPTPSKVVKTSVHVSPSSIRYGKIHREDKMKMKSMGKGRGKAKGKA